MADLPTGTVTLLFTDIEGSTRLLQQQGAHYGALLAEYQDLLRAIFQTHGGHEVDTQGDSFFVVFPRAVDAVRAAVAAQHAIATHSWPEGVTFRTRMGVHTGEPEVRSSDYVGLDVHRAARLMAAGHGGQVLLSQATQVLVEHDLPSRVELRDLGEHRLKDLQQPEHLFQLVIPDLPSDFPPIKTLDTRLNNLPLQTTSFIGREQEAAAVCQRLRDPQVRLVTLIGAGGSGKTRLAIQVATEVLDDFPDGIWFVDLAPITDPALVASTIAQALALKEVAGQVLVDTLKTYLHDKQLLLVLDNFEQVVAAAPRVADLLKTAPHLKILVTSRTVLHLSGEHEFPVPPLALPDPTQLPDLESLSQYAAVALFIERAQAVKPDFQVTNQTAPAVAEICARLDGLPLAIELAAARSKLFTPPALLARLGRSLQFLTSGPRDLPARQQTIRATIDWSYSLLDPAEQTLFARLAVFVGGWTLAAAEAVCMAAGDLDLDLLDGLQSLLDKSLLRQEADRDGEPRFRRLETIREYARERLEASGEGEALRQQHTSYYLALAEEAEVALRGATQPAWLDRLEAEHANLRAALAWSEATGNAAVGLRLVGALWRFWFLRGFFEEWERWLAAVLAWPVAGRGLPEAQYGPLRAKVLLGRAILAWNEHDTARAQALGEESLALYQAAGDQWGVAAATTILGKSLLDLGDVARAQARLDEGERLARAVGDSWLITFALIDRARLVQLQGDVAQALTWSTEGLERARAIGDPWLIAWALYQMVRPAWAQKDYGRARTLLEECLALRRSLGDKLGIAWALVSLGDLDMAQGQYAAARAHNEERLHIERELGNQRGVWHALMTLAQIAYAQGDPVQAVRWSDESVALARGLDSPRDLMWARSEQGWLALSAKDYTQAEACFTEVLALAQEHGDQRWQVDTLLNLGWTRLAQGDQSGAQTYFTRTLVRGQHVGLPDIIVESLYGLAGAAAVGGHLAQAARLSGAAAAASDGRGADLWRVPRSVYERARDAAQVDPSDHTWTVPWAEGQAMTLEQAIAYALEETGEPWS